MINHKPIYLSDETIDKQDIDNLISWLGQDPIPRLTKGQKTIEYEQLFSKLNGSSWSVFVNSGSSAILLMLWVCITRGLRNNKIIVPSLSWHTDVSSTIQLGLEPILCDCNFDDLSVDLNHLEELFKKYNPSVFLLVSVLGLVPDMDSITSLCNKYGVILLEDNCESLHSEYKGIKLGNFGLMSCFSTYFSHHYSTIEGGMITTNSKEIYNLLLMLRSHGWARDLEIEDQKKLEELENISDFEKSYTFIECGFNLRSTDLQAVLGLSQLQKVPSFVKKREENFKLFKKWIKNNKLTLTEYPDRKISNFAFPLLVENREPIIKELIQNQVEIRPIISGSMGLQPFWKRRYGPIHLKNCDQIHTNGFYLPNHQNIQEDDIIRMGEIINKYG
jgi:CDP-6-deoxy-D-xylo-4-hexulose-3-dehydrase